MNNNNNKECCGAIHSPTPISEIIRQRIIDAGEQYFSNDNISKFINDDELELLKAEVKEKQEALMRSLIIDVDNDHNSQDTPNRVSKMQIYETMSGRYLPTPKVTSFPNVNYEGLYVSGPISIRSLCAHHWQNIVGKCWIGVHPEEEVIGLSKFNRLVDHIASRPQIQEEMTTQIADVISEYTKTENVAVVVKAEHHCLTMRGMREHDSDMTTAVIRGKFKTEQSLKNEFYQILSGMKGYK